MAKVMQAWRNTLTLPISVEEGPLKCNLMAKKKSWADQKYLDRSFSWGVNYNIDRAHNADLLSAETIVNKKSQTNIYLSVCGWSSDYRICQRYRTFKAHIFWGSQQYYSDFKLLLLINGTIHTVLGTFWAHKWEWFQSPETHSKSDKQIHAARSVRRGTKGIFCTY